MAIYITENGNVNYENQDDVNRKLFPNEVNASHLKTRLESLESSVSDITIRLTSLEAKHEALLRHLAVTAGEFVPNDSSVVNYITIRRSGTVYTMFGFLQNVNISSANTETDIGIIENAKPPANPIRGICNVSDNAYSYGASAYFVVSSTGKVSINSPITGNKAVMFHCSWIVADD